MKIKGWFLLGLSSVQISCQERSWYCISTTWSIFSSCCQKIKSFYYFTKISIITMTTNPWPGEYHKVMWQERATKGNNEELFWKHSSLWKYSFFRKSVDSLNKKTKKKRLHWSSQRYSKYRPRFHPRLCLHFSTVQAKPLKEHFWFCWNREGSHVCR